MHHAVDLPDSITELAQHDGRAAWDDVDVEVLEVIDQNVAEIRRGSQVSDRQDLEAQTSGEEAVSIVGGVELFRVDQANVERRLVTPEALDISAGTLVSKPTSRADSDALDKQKHTSSHRFWDGQADETDDLPKASSPGADYQGTSSLLEDGGPPRDHTQSNELGSEDCSAEEDVTSEAGVSLSASVTSFHVSSIERLIESRLFCQLAARSVIS